VDDELVSLKDVAGLLELPNTAVMDLVRRGELTAARMPAGPATWRVARSEVAAYADRATADDPDRKARTQRERAAALHRALRELTPDESQNLVRDLSPEWTGLMTRWLATAHADGHAGHLAVGVGAAEVAELHAAYRALADDELVALAANLPQRVFWALSSLAVAPD
jgi:excisionase family DNA binding protein